MDGKTIVARLYSVSEGKQCSGEGSGGGGEGERDTLYEDGEVVRLREGKKMVRMCTVVSCVAY